MSPAKKPLRLGIRQKMILVLLTVLTIALSITGWITLRQINDNVFRETQTRGEELVRIVSESIAYSVVGYDYQTIQLLLDKLVTSPDIVYTHVVNSRGNIMATAGLRPKPGSSAEMFSADIVFDEKVIGQLTMGLDMTRIVQQLNKQAENVVIREAVIVLLIAIGEFLALSYIIMRPVTIISRSLHADRANHDNVTLIPLTSHDEFGELARQFNETRIQLSDANKKLRSRIDLADTQLRETNEQLRKQSEELKRVNEELRRLSITDPLTGLYNRREFEQLMATDILLSLRHNEPNSLMLVDIDFFKKINDTYGHAAGDRVLRRLSTILSENLRRSDVLCRLGGEEFVVLCRRANREKAMLVAENIRRVVEAHEFHTGNQIVHITISVGIASIPSEDNVRTTDELFQQADSALYYSKTKGRNRITHFGDITTKIRHEPSLSKT